MTLLFSCASCPVIAPLLTYTRSLDVCLYERLLVFRCAFLVQRLHALRVPSPSCAVKKSDAQASVVCVCVSEKLVCKTHSLSLCASSCLMMSLFSPVIVKLSFISRVMMQGGRGKERSRVLLSRRARCTHSLAHTHTRFMHAQASLSASLSLAISLPLSLLRHPLSSCDSVSAWASSSSPVPVPRRGAAAAAATAAAALPSFLSLALLWVLFKLLLRLVLSCSVSPSSCASSFLTLFHSLVLLAAALPATAAAVAAVGAAAGASRFARRSSF